MADSMVRTAVLLFAAVIAIIAVAIPALWVLALIYDWGFTAGFLFSAFLTLEAGVLWAVMFTYIINHSDI